MRAFHARHSSSHHTKITRRRLMLKRISLWASRSSEVFSEDGGIPMLQYSRPPLDVAAPYEREETRQKHEKLLYCPSLRSLCIKRLVDYPEQMHVLGPMRLLYEKPKSPQQHDLLKELIPGFSHSSEPQDDFDLDTFLERVDPRLWAVLVQVYTGLPQSLTTYTIPLTDAHLPLLQQVPCTRHFSLVTVLELCDCQDLTDSTLYRLRDLPSLAALDLASTKVTSWGISTFARTMQVKRSSEVSRESALEGPWRLRILSLRNCHKIDNDIFDSLRYFPLLSVIDLRGTRCSPSTIANAVFRPTTNARLFYPSPPRQSLDELSTIATAEDASVHTLYSSSDPYFLRIASQYHGSRPVRRAHSTAELSTRTRRPLPTVNWTLFSAQDADAQQQQLVNHEMRRDASRVAATAFYAGTYRHESVHARDNPPNALQPLRDHLALYRPPPPYAALLEAAADSLRPKSKRPRTSIDEPKSLSPSKPNNKTMNSLLQSRSESVTMPISEFEKDRRERRKVAVSANPFAKGARMPISVFEEEARKRAEASTVHEASSISMARSKMTTVAKSPTQPNSTTPLVLRAPPPVHIEPFPPTNKRKRKAPSLNTHESIAERAARPSPSTFPIPKRSTKPLRPISQLPVPIFPPGSIPLIKPTKSKHSSSLDSTIKKQTDLSSFLKKNTVAASLPRTGHGSAAATADLSADTNKTGENASTSRRRSSASATEPKRHSSSAAGPSRQQRRKSSDETSFDWNGWSGK